MSNGNGNGKPKIPITSQIKPGAPAKTIGVVTLTSKSDGSLTITNFPSMLIPALDLLFSALKIVIISFITQAKAGNLDNNNAVIPSKIIKKDKTLVDLSGKPLQ